MRLQLEGGEWKIARETWAREKPVEIQPVRFPVPAGGPARDMTKPHARSKPPTLKLARPECSYKGVMSDEEIDRCR